LRRFLIVCLLAVLFVSACASSTAPTPQDPDGHSATSDGEIVCTTTVGDMTVYLRVGEGTSTCDTRQSVVQAQFQTQGNVTCTGISWDANWNCSYAPPDAVGPAMPGENSPLPDPSTYTADDIGTAGSNDYEDLQGHTFIACVNESDC
jgi:hypothetical protein